MEEYAQTSAFDRVDRGESIIGAAQLGQAQKPRLASLIDRLSQLNNHAIEIVITAASELDRIIGVSPANGTGSGVGPVSAVNCAVAELDSLVDDLSSKLSAIGREVNRLRGL